MPHTQCISRLYPAVYIRILYYSLTFIGEIQHTHSYHSLHVVLKLSKEWPAKICYPSPQIVPIDSLDKDHAISSIDY